jgi:hypothetical protein
MSDLQNSVNRLVVATQETTNYIRRLASTNPQRAVEMAITQYVDTVQTLITIVHEQQALHAGVLALQAIHKAKTGESA